MHYKFFTESTESQWVFSVEFVCSPCVFVGFLLVFRPSPTVQRQAGGGSGNWQC